MEKDEFSELEESLKDLDLGIGENDGALTRFAKKFATNVIKKCIKDRSGAAFYKVANFTMGIANGNGNNDLMDLINDGFLLNNAESLHQAYKCLDQILTTDPKSTKDVVESVVKSSIRKENDENSVKDVFAICEKVKLKNPDYAEDMDEIKKNALKSLCNNSPAKGMKAISGLVADTYPSKEDLSMIYEGLSTIMDKSDLNKKAYPPMLKLLEECSKSGYNTGENAKKINKLCETIQARNPDFGAQIKLIKNNVNKNNKAPVKKQIQR